MLPGYIFLWLEEMAAMKARKKKGADPEEGDKELLRALGKSFDRQLKRFDNKLSVTRMFEDRYGVTAWVNGGSAQFKSE